MQDLTARVTRLEKEARAWRLAALVVTTAALVGLGVGQVTAQGEGTTLKAPVTVIDGKGNRVMQVKAFSTATGLTLLPAEGESSVVLMAGKGMTSISASTAPGQSSFSTLTTQVAADVFLRNGENTSAFLTGSRQGGAFKLNGSDGKPIFEKP